MAKRPASTASGESRPLNAACRFVVLHGDEVFLRHLHTTALRTDLIKTFGEIDVVQFDGSATTAADVLDECRSFGLIATHKLVIVDNADDAVKEENRALFERYAQSLIDAKGESSATLVLRCKSWRAGKLDKQIEQVGVIQACEAPTDEKAIVWAMARCRRTHQGDLPREAAELLVSRVGASLGRIDSELGKLVSAAGLDEAGKPKPIQPSLVAEFVGQSREERVWDIQDGLLSNDPARVLSDLTDALEVSRHDPSLIFFAYCDIARKLHAASHGVRQGLGEWQLKGTLKLWGSSVGAVLGAAGRIPPPEARRLLNVALTNMTRSRSSLGESVRTLERTALEFTPAVHRTRH